MERDGTVRRILCVSKVLSRGRWFAGGLIARCPEGMRDLGYAGYRFPPDPIHQAIRLSLRFMLSFRDVEDLLAEHGTAVSCETVRRWVNHLGR